MTNPKYYSAAFPPIPSQDQFGRIVSLMPGMTLLDYAAIKIYSANANNLGIEESISIAKQLLDELWAIQSRDNSNNVINIEAK